MEGGCTPVYSRKRKVAISLFILFHLGCVIVWLLPRESLLRRCLLEVSVSLPTRDKGAGDKSASWDLEPRQVIPSYLFNTAQYQGWSMFAPDPVQNNRYAAASVLCEDGNWRDYVFPRLSEMGFLEAWLQKRYRKLSQNLFDEDSRPLHEDLARWVARRMNDTGNRPVRVVLVVYESAIPRHDRDELRGPGAPAWVDYSDLLRRKAKFAKRVVLDYFVKPEDLQ